MTAPKTRVMKDDPFVRSAERFRLSVAGGPSVESATPVRVGSQEGNGLLLENSSVSRYHFEIEPGRDGFLLRDLGSTNGTFVDGYRVREIFLPARATLKAGEVSIAFELLGDEELIELSKSDRFGGIIGSSPPMREMFGLLERVAARELTILIEGESGTGKEMLAEAIHERSSRAKGPLVVFDCASVPPSLMESELFGHERGAFTGADSARAGRFEEARGGTLFLDELGELPLELQPKLLRVVERREVRRVGGTHTIPIDVRIVAATNRDLAREVNRGAFREDLYYRLAVVRLRIPPLRARAADIPLLIEHFVHEAFEGDLTRAIEVVGGISEASWRALSEHPWPGNVRELRNFVERTLALSGGVDAANVPERSRGRGNPRESEQKLDLARPFIELREELLASFELRYLEAILRQHDGNISRAARAAGLDRMHFKRLLARRQTQLSE